MKTAPLLLLTTAALILWPAPPIGADVPPRYRLTVLPLDFYGYNEVDSEDRRGGINALGQIVGSVSVRSGSIQDDRVALWQKGRPLRILDKRPVTREDTDSDRDFLYATAINTRGETIGAETVSSSGAYTIRTSTACILWNGRLNRLYGGFPSRRRPVAGDDTNSVAVGLNDHGDVVGGFIDNNNFTQTQDDYPPAPPGEDGRHAFLRRGGRITRLWPGVARGINNRGWIVGVKDAGFYASHAKGVLWRNGHITLLSMQPVAINGRGEIAGNIPLTEDTGRACVWRRGRVTLLSRQISHAFALNSRGAVVGERDDPASSHPARAALWRRCRAYDLNRCVGLPANWVLQSATGINDKGWIIGNGSIYKTPRDKQPVKFFSFLLKPR